MLYYKLHSFDIKVYIYNRVNYFYISFSEASGKQTSFPKMHCEYVMYSRN